jgi:hypothetical protein
LSTPVVPLTTVEIDKTEPPSLPNRTVPFSCFEQELLTPCSIHVPTGSSAYTMILLAVVVPVPILPPVSLMPSPSEPSGLGS